MIDSVCSVFYHWGMFELMLISAGLISFIACVISIPILIRLSEKYHWFDEIDDRKIHTGQISRLAGVAVFYAMLLGMIIGLFLVDRQTGIMEDFPILRMVKFFAAYFLIHLIGLIDDFRSVSPRMKFLVQIIASFIVVFPDGNLSQLYIPFWDLSLNIGWFGYPLSIIWIIGACNAVNLIDGMDGLSGGLSAIAAMFLAIIAILLGNPVTAIISFALFGALIGFLVFNFPPAKIFIGDSGALFLGFAIASLPLLEINYHSDMSLIIAISILFIPCVDTLTSILRRLRRLQSPFYPDREHLHHKLMDRNFSTKQILFTLYSLSILICSIVFIWAITGNTFFIAVDMVVWAFLIVLFLALEKRHGDKTQ